MVDKENSAVDLASTCKIGEGKAPQRVYFVVHQGRAQAAEAADKMREQLSALGVEVVNSPEQAQLVVAFGGDGTILDAAAAACHTSAPILGVNMGHVGFLAEAEPEALTTLVGCIKEGHYSVEKRLTLEVEVRLPATSEQIRDPVAFNLRQDKSGAWWQVETSWALNEVAVSKHTSLMIETALGVDGHAISSFSTDGIVFSTPTGSTAYAFSCGGPVVWPDVDAVLVVPISAHALFTRPLVVGTESVLQVRLLSDGATVWCDGRRQIPLRKDAVVIVKKSQKTVNFARFNQLPFASRLVRKFKLPTQGWRQGEDDKVETWDLDPLE